MSAVKDLLTDFLSVFENYNSDKDNDLKIWGEAMTEHIDDQIEALNKQKEALEKANDEEERAITLAKLQAELEKARTQRTVRKYTSNGYEWVSDASAVKEAQDNLNDQQRTWRKEDAEKAIDDQIDKLNELKDKYSEIINLIGTSWDDYNKKLKYSAEIADMTFTEMEGRLDVFKGNANNYSHPTSAGNKHIPGGGESGQILRWSADGTAVWGPDYNTTYSDFKAATASAAGGSGLVPAPAAGKQSQYLRGDGTWATPTNTTYSDVTQSTHGLMTAADKKKLDGFSAASSYALKSDITAMYRYKGSVSSVDKLPTSNQTVGDVYDVGNGMNYAWDGTKWDALGEVFTITKITNTEIDTVLAS